MASARSGTTVGSTTGGGAPRAARETTADYVFGEELGRGSYSTARSSVHVELVLLTDNTGRPRRSSLYLFHSPGLAHLPESTSQAVRRQNHQSSAPHPRAQDEIRHDRARRARSARRTPRRTCYWRTIRQRPSASAIRFQCSDARRAAESDEYRRCPRWVVRAERQYHHHAWRHTLLFIAGPYAFSGSVQLGIYIKLNTRFQHDGRSSRAASEQIRRSTRGRP